MTICKVLSAQDWTSYRHLTLPSVQRRIDQNIHNNEQLLLVGAETGGEPLALAVVERHPSRAIGILHSIWVAPARRRMGLANQLMEQIRSNCHKHHIHLLRYAYYSGKSYVPALEAWLKQGGWSNPKCEAAVYHLDHRIARAPWLKERALPQGLHLLPWVDIREELKERLLQSSGEIPSFLSPFKTFAPLEPLNSLGILSREQIVGWSISYRIQADTILYDALFVRPEYQLSGVSFAMLAKAIIMQLEHGIPYGMFVVRQNTTHMWKLAQKWIAPYAVKVNERRSSYLLLS